MELTQRTELLLGTRAVDRLRGAKVMVIGLGGVGSYAAEALARSGIGALVLVDGDTVAPSNLNRQLIALHSTVGMPKTEAARQRIADINPLCRTECVDAFLTAEQVMAWSFEGCDYVVDAIDTVTVKLALAQRAWEIGVPIISCMGTGNKLDPARFEIADIFQTSVCPLAKVIRTQLRKRGVPQLRVVYSKEEPARGVVQDGARHAPGSVSFVPGAAGLILAGEVIKALAFQEKEGN
ncbi:MAG: tRNA threonylcarbamoyladenosine dehydratase [Clostridiales bacterium]|nr:tRNA threonylcarbamoyladenosine dehydratase [Clostridiales bacterium]